MKLKAKAANVERLTFNDLGKVVKGVAPQERFIALDPDEAIYLPNDSGVLFSASQGDVKRYVANDMLEVNDVVTLADTEELVAAHGFGFIPNVIVAKDSSGEWVSAVEGTDYQIITNAAMTETKVKNISGGSLDLNINIG